MNRVIRLSFAFVVLITASLWAQEDFSADIVNNKGDGQQGKARIYVTKDKWRIEGLGEGRMGGAVITNLKTQMSDIIIPDRKMYMEFPQGQGPGAQRMWSFYQARNIDDACSDWLSLSYNKGGTCKKVGSDTVNGRSAIKYEGTNANGETGTIWLDKKIAFPIKWEGKNGGGELQNIKEGSQPSSLFDIPSDYQKMQMPAGMPNMPSPRH